MTKKKNTTIFLLSIIIFSVTSCRDDVQLFQYQDHSKVEFREENGKWTLYRNNEPYFIKGAHGSVRLDWVKEKGGNSILVYQNEVNDSLLDLAHSLGISVSITLDVGKPRYEDVDYTDEEFRMNQRAKISDFVTTYHKHPAILFWIVGNELHITRRNNIALWREVNEISKIIHAIDPYHPTTTTIASFPTASFQTLLVKLFAPDLDFLSLNIYEFAPRIRRESNSFVWGINGPFLVTEWAGQPYWMYPRTEWDAIIEHSSTRNAQLFSHYNHLIFDLNKEKCIGGYVFYWGEKQERTHTVFSLIHEEKYKTQAMEHIQYFWTENYPTNWAPRIDTFLIEGYAPGKAYFDPDMKMTATIDAFDPDEDPMYMKWELRTEAYVRGKTGGESERLTDIIATSDSIIPYQRNFNFTTPEKSGPFRLFVYVYDNNDYIATANIPIYVFSDL